MAEHADIEIRVEELAATIAADPDAFKELIAGTLQAAEESGKHILANADLADTLVEFID